MNIFELTRQPRIALMGTYLLTLAEGDVSGERAAAGMTREGLAAAIAGDRDRGRRVRAMAAAERRAARWREARDQRHVA